MDNQNNTMPYEKETRRFYCYDESKQTVMFNDGRTVLANHAVVADLYYLDECYFDTDGTTLGIGKPVKKHENILLEFDFKTVVRTTEQVGANQRPIPKWIIPQPEGNDLDEFVCYTEEFIKTGSGMYSVERVPKTDAGFVVRIRSFKF